MKKRTGSKSVLSLLLCATIGFAAACDFGLSEDGSSGSGGPGDTIDASVSLKFDLDGAEAIAGSEESSRSGRAGANDSALVKILEDGTIASLFQFEDGVTVEAWPAVEYLAKAPSSGEIYVYFSNDLYLTSTGSEEPGSGPEDTDPSLEEPTMVEKALTSGKRLLNRAEEMIEGEAGGENLISNSVGRLICIRTDGTFVDILKRDNGVWATLHEAINSDKPSIIFDATGRMYYILSEYEVSSWTQSTAIYRFDPQSGESTPMTAAQDKIVYEDFFVSSDGSHIFAKVFKFDSESTYTSYLRAIPVDDPGNYKNIYYSSNSSEFVSSYTISPVTNTVYFSGNNIGGKTVFFSANKSDYSVKIHEIQRADTTWLTDFFDISGNDWAGTFKDTDGTLKADDLMAKLRTCTVYPGFSKDLTLNKINTECSLGLSAAELELKNDAALLALTVGEDSHVSKIVTQYFGRNEIGYPDKFMDSQFLISFFDITRAEVESYISFSNSLNAASDGSIWGLTEEFKPVEGGTYATFITFMKLFAADGSPDVKIPEAFSGGKFKPIKIESGEGYLYFSCARMLDDGSESGYHTIKRVSLENPDLLEDVLPEDIAALNLEINDFSLSGDKVYFSAVKGIDQIVGSVDVANGMVYDEISSGFKISKILAY